MSRLTNAKVADMHLAYGAANGIAGQTASLGPLHTWSYIECFQTYTKGSGHQRRVDVKEAVLDHFHRNPRASARSCPALG